MGVSILPGNSRTPWDLIGQMTGQNISQNLPGAVQQGYQRQQGLNAIDQLQNDLAQSGGDISRILPALARAYTLNPTLERSGLGQEFLKNQAQGMYPGALESAGNNNVSSTPTGQAQVDQNLVAPIAASTQQTQPIGAPKGKQTAQNIDAIANQYLGEMRPDLLNPATQYGAVNTFDSAIKQDLTPEEESRLRQQIMDKYKNPNVVNSVVDRVREGIKNKYNEALAKYGFDQDRLNQVKDKWNTFTNGTPQRLEPFLSKYGEDFPRTKDILQNKYNQYAGALPINMTPEQMHSNSMELLQRDINKLDALNNIPSMPPLRTQGDASEYINSHKDAYKDLADQGFTEALREDAIINKDLGNEEFHSLIWGDQTNKKLLNSIHSFKAPKEYGTSGIPHDAYTYNPNFPKEHEKYINNVSNSLTKMGPNDDLILARAMVLDNGGEVKDFMQALAKAQEKGLKLSEFQKGQLQEINIPRVPPLWEIFSDKGQGGIPTPFGSARFLNWTPFINYLRGKK